MRIKDVDAISSNDYSNEEITNCQGSSIKIL